MATTSAMGELRWAIVEAAAEVASVVSELELEVLPAAAAGVELAVLVAAAVAEATALPRVEDTCPPELPTSIFLSTVLSVLLHLPARLLNFEESVTAAGVEPQLMYCCMCMALLSRSKTAVMMI